MRVSASSWKQGDIAARLSLCGVLMTMVVRVDINCFVGGSSVFSISSAMSTNSAVLLPSTLQHPWMFPCTLVCSDMADTSPSVLSGTEFQTVLFVDVPYNVQSR